MSSVKREVSYMSMSRPVKVGHDNACACYVHVSKLRAKAKIILSFKIDNKQTVAYMLKKWRKIYVVEKP